MKKIGKEEQGFKKDTKWCHFKPIKKLSEQLQRKTVEVLMKNGRKIC